MLVLEPGKRYTIPQIKGHRWMAGVVDANDSELSSAATATATQTVKEPNEQILRLMHSLGIDVARTREVNFFYE